MRKILIWIAGAALIFTAAGKARAAILTPEGKEESVSWTEEEKSKEVAIKLLRTTAYASHHAVRLVTHEKPHIHKEHDGTVTILSGKILMHLGDKTLPAEKGDVIFIPQGKVHWGENAGTESAEAYVVFTPPYDGTDYMEVEAETRR